VPTRPCPNMIDSLSASSQALLAIREAQAFGLVCNPDAVHLGLSLVDRAIGR